MKRNSRLHGLMIEIEIADVVERETEPKVRKRGEIFLFHVTAVLDHALREFEVHAFGEVPVLLHERDEFRENSESSNEWAEILQNTPRALLRS